MGLTTISGKQLGTGYTGLGNRYLSDDGTWKAGALTQWTSAGNDINYGTGLVQILGNSLGAAAISTFGLQLLNNSAATSSVVQTSPSLLLGGQGWNTGNLATSPAQFRFYVNPAISSTMLVSQLLIQSVNNGVWTTALQLGTGGATFSGAVTSNQNFVFSSGNIGNGVLNITGLTGTGNASTTIDCLNLSSAAATSTPNRAVMYSPAITQSASALNAAGTPVAQTASFRSEVRPASGTTPITAKYFISRQIAGGGYVDILAIDGAGDIEILSLNKGIIIKSPNGTRYRLTPTDAGATVWTSL